MRRDGTRKLHVLGLLLGVALSLFFNQSDVRASEDPKLELTVEQGDSLINLGNKYLENPEDWREIATLNSLQDADRIYPGQRLLIPIRLLRGIPLACEVTFLKGDVRARKEPAGPWVSLRLGDRVAQGDSVQTGQESAAELTFEDGVTFFLQPGTSLKVEIAQKKGPAHIFRDFFIEVGKILVRIKGATGTDSRNKIRTPSAVASARGTEFRVFVDSEGSTRSEVLEGRIEVGAMNRSVELQEGEGTWVKRGEPPLPPSKLLPPPVPIDLKPVYEKIPFQVAFGQIKDSSRIRVMVAVDRDHKNILQEKVIPTGEKVEISGLRDGDYYLFTQSIDGMGLEGPSSQPFPLKLRMTSSSPFFPGCAVKRPNSGSGP